MQKTYALFDFDGTLIRGDSIALLCGYAARRGLARPGQTLAALGAAVLYGLKLWPAVRSKEQALAFLRGKTLAQVEAIAQDFCREVLAPRLRPQGLAEIAAHRAAGHEVLLITASSTFYLLPLQSVLGVDAIIGTRFDLDEQRGFTGRVCGENCRGVQKPLRLAEYLAARGDRLEYATSAAYGDSRGDLPMLRLCADKVGVNPRRRLWRALRTLEGARRVRWAEPPAQG